MSTYAFQLAQHRLNLVKKNAHDIVGCKREQVARVVENIAVPGEYVITVHQNGRVEHHTWRAPSLDELNAATEAPEPTFPLITPTPEPQSQETQYASSPTSLLSPVSEPTPAPEVSETPSAATVFEDVISEPVETEEVSATAPFGEDSAPKTDLAEGQEESPTAPESPAAAKPAPRRRGRPKKS